MPKVWALLVRWVHPPATVPFDYPADDPDYIREFNK